MLAYIEANYDLEELGWSMAERGYFAEEPLLVIDAHAVADARRMVIEKKISTMLSQDPTSDVKCSMIRGVLSQPRLQFSIEAQGRVPYRGGRVWDRTCGRSGR